MNKKVREYLMQLSPLTRRLMESFPDVRMRISEFKDKIEAKINNK